MKLNVHGANTNTNFIVQTRIYNTSHALFYDNIAAFSEDGYTCIIYIIELEDFMYK